MEKIIVRVEGMSCEHCENAINTAVGELPGVQEVHADRLTKEVSVVFDSALVQLSDIQAAIIAEEFEVIA